MVFIRASPREAYARPTSWFQSLNRDGVHSRLKHIESGALLVQVSIPQSGWCSFALSHNRVDTAVRQFQSLNRDGVHSRAIDARADAIGQTFQSLNRDGVHSRASSNRLAGGGMSSLV